MQRFEPEPALATMAETGTTVLMGVPTMCITLARRADRRRSASSPDRTRRRRRRPDRRRAALRGDVCSRHPRGLRPDRDERSRDDLRDRTTAKARLRGAAVEQHRRSHRESGRAGVGEVQFRGPSVIQGYWNDPGATAAAIDGEGWLSTGDLGRLDEDGDLFLVDRTKEMIIRAATTSTRARSRRCCTSTRPSSKPSSSACPTRRSARTSPPSWWRVPRPSSIPTSSRLGEGARCRVQVPAPRRGRRRAAEEPDGEDPQARHRPDSVVRESRAQRVTGVAAVTCGGDEAPGSSG